ncbi:MAG: heavy-metal-associated domain-containing protein [Candidatus Nitrosocosmicus sp.]|nr:heavy-metal-associated domain-containing protein [Candidatus Nitrosocosmicus sp.]
MPSYEKIHFKVVGMYCTTCKPIVEKQLKNNNGIKKIDINYMTDSVVIEFDPTLTNIKEIKESLGNSGYKFVRAPRY